MRILIVEDSLKMRELLRAILNDVAEITECSDGDEALAAFSLCQPDCVLMDVKMKRMNGIQATQTIKKSFPQARIIILTRYNDAEIQAAAREAGATDYFVKDDLTALRRFLLNANQLM